jgi:hypothetical protein
MKLWLLSQDKNNDYDTYDSCVVVAETEQDAKSIHPDRDYCYRKGYDGYKKTWCYGWFYKRGDGSDYLSFFASSAWVTTPLDVKATYIGEADSKLEAGEVVCASFNAG